jgi:hypothetical protein
LRHAFDRLAARIDALFEMHVGRFVPDPWCALEDYLSVRGGQSAWEDFLERHDSRANWQASRQLLEGLFEAQYFRQVMFTSCAYFFEDVDRLEPRAAIARAARAISYAEASCDFRLTQGFVADLARVRSNRSPITGANLYRQVLPRSGGELSPRPNRPASTQSAVSRGAS